MLAEKISDYLNSKSIPNLVITEFHIKVFKGTPLICHDVYVSERGTVKVRLNGAKKSELIMGQLSEISHLAYYLSQHITPMEPVDPPICPYCGNKSKLVSSIEVYGKDFGPIYLCRCIPGFAYVGCHKGTVRPLGVLADSRLREMRKRVHYEFDPIWRVGIKKRQEAYNWLAGEMGISPLECHIGSFDIKMCEKAYEIIKDFKSTLSLGDFYGSEETKIREWEEVQTTLC